MATPQDDQQTPEPPQKKGRDLQPLREDELKKKLEHDKTLTGTDNDVLAELAAKTAALTQGMEDDEIKEKILTLDDPENANPEDIAAALDNTNQTTQETASTKNENMNPAAEVIRDKLRKLYSKEPDAASEAAEAVVNVHRSKHQQFMYELTTSGKSLADIQTAWHEYYVNLPDDEKHEVWQEFYKNQHQFSAYGRHNEISKAQESGKKEPEPAKKKQSKKRPADIFSHESRTPRRKSTEIKSQLLDKVSAGGQLKPIHHIKSALFGIGLAGFVGLVVAFIFFNQVFIAPFISPSQSVSATPIIGQVDGDVGPEPKIIIPKINLEVPVVYGLKTVEEQTIQDSLEDGVVHYAASPEPGEEGNSVIVGHSSNNILNSGRYKFAFVLLKRLEKDDTFFIHKDGVRYTYKIYEKRVVPPTETSVLGPADRDNTMTLITCDPPGTSINRLIVVAEQISPDPADNTEATIDVEEESTESLPSDAPSLWSRFWPF